MKKIPLTGNDFALVDDADFPYLNQFNWFTHRRGNLLYARRTETKNGKTRKILMHRDILQIESLIRIDHENGNGLDNRRKNLRPATHAQNMRNRRQTNGQSGFKGVWLTKNGRFIAAITHNGRTVNLGTFRSAKEAALVYDEKAAELFGEFASPNF